ncbi:MAG: FAD:protein FMN transferase [Candidatus Neomarinimicrobiota bacterium]|nr:FAD:protein FMN transferase [Candidatus Neomarinimicrobiota bacterium]
MKKNIIISLIIITLCNSCDITNHQIKLSGFTMGTTYNIKIILDNLSVQYKNKLSGQIDSILISINQQMSTYLYDSEISTFNNNESTAPFKISNEFSYVVGRALHWAKTTEGAFDITLVPLLYLWGFGPGQKGGLKDVFPDEKIINNRKIHMGYDKLTINNNFLQKKDPFIKIDLNAIAKGFGVDAICNFLNSKGINNYMVEIGGEVRCVGYNQNKKSWMIAIENPENNNKIKWAVSLKDVSMATSGDYRNYYEIDNERYSHEIDPRSGYPAQTNIASATVVAPNCVDADALATTLIILGIEKAIQLIENTNDTEAFLIIRKDKDSYETIKSSGMKIEVL